jgi:hypothetical protein
MGDSSCGDREIIKVAIEPFGSRNCFCVLFVTISVVCTNKPEGQAQDWDWLFGCNATIGTGTQKIAVVDVVVDGRPGMVGKKAVQTKKKTRRRRRRRRRRGQQEEKGGAEADAQRGGCELRTANWERTA